jgi:hypothetical protein
MASPGVWMANGAGTIVATSPNLQTQEIGLRHELVSFKILTSPKRDTPSWRSIHALSKLIVFVLYMLYL